MAAAAAAAASPATCKRLASLACASSHSTRLDPTQCNPDQPNSTRFHFARNLLLLPLTQQTGWLAGSRKLEYIDKRPLPIQCGHWLSWLPNPFPLGGFIRAATWRLVERGQLKVVSAAQLPGRRRGPIQVSSGRLGERYGGADIGRTRASSAGGSTAAAAVAAAVEPRVSSKRDLLTRQTMSRLGRAGGGLHARRARFHLTRVTRGA